MKARDATPRKELEVQNRRLRIAVARLTPDTAMLKELAEANF